MQVGGPVKMCEEEAEIAYDRQKTWNSISNDFSNIHCVRLVLSINSVVFATLEELDD